MKILIFIFLIVVNCKSASKIESVGTINSASFIKKEGFNETTKKVSTLSIYNKTNKKLGDLSDIIANIIGSTIDSKVSEIYGESIVGGQAIQDLANKLKIKDLDKIIQNLVESQLDGQSINSDTKKALSTIIEKGKIDSLAIPVISNTSERLFQDEKLKLYLIVYDGKSANVQYLATSENISIKPEDKLLLSTKPDQAKANTTATMIEITNRFMVYIQSNIRKGSVSNEIAKSSPPVKEVVTEQSDEKPKEKELLEPFDEWLKSKIKIGLGPLTMGILGFFILTL